MSDPFNLSKQRMEELRYAWRHVKFFFKIKTDTMTYTQFLFLLKSLGIILSREEQSVLQQEHAIRGGFTLEDLFHVGSVAWTEEAIEEALLTGLSLLDPQGTGKVSVYDVREILYKLGVGIRLSYAEIDMFLEYFDSHTDGQVPVDALVRR